MKRVLVTALVAICAMVLLAAWCEYRARTLSERAVSSHDREEFEFWRARLLPLYRDMDLKHDEEPATKEELFEPLLRSLEPMQAKLNPTATMTERETGQAAENSQQPNSGS